ncbi:capsule biosynthesis GfcC D2 domain-containing protein [Enterobacter sp. ECC-175]|uniref:capsule biosynthesis GfcC D2 domain-containing protein n=1 Tax=Enterobacter sp. ECC-175 TaxID=3116479 RepID=UPI003754B561
MNMRFTLPIGILLFATCAGAAEQNVVMLYGPDAERPIAIEGKRRLAELVTSPEVSASAWWPGAILTTDRANREANALRQRVLGDLARWELRADAPLAATLRSVREQLARRAVVGRLFVELDPDAVRTQPEANLRLQGQYRLYLTPRPDAVTLLGAVDLPGPQPWRPGASVRDYLKGRAFLAGANSHSVTVISPSGKSATVPIAFWNARHREAEPGSLIWVGLAEDDRGLNAQIIRLLAQRENK